jgi:hypothetical protein
MELVRLKRSYRVMQNDYKAYKEQTKRSVNKQNSLIEELERERGELDTMMSNMGSEQNVEKDEQNTRTLQELSASESHYQKAIATERHSLASLDVVMMELERKITEQRKVMGGVHMSTSKHIAAAKRKAVLENRLDKAVVLFNRQLADNAKLREEIDHYRQERQLFEGLFTRLTKELDHTQKDIGDVIKVSTQAFEQRDEAHTKVCALKERGEKEQKQHDIEMKELQRIISHDNRMKEFMFIKTNERTEYKAEEALKKKRHQATMDADQIFMKTYEEAFDRIKLVTGLSDVKEIVSSFVVNEGDNFALFNYVNELNCEAESLQEEVSQIKELIDTFLAQDNQVDTQHTDLVKNLEIQYRAIEEVSIKAERRLKKVNKVLDHVKHGIEKLFKRLGCDLAPIVAMLGGDAGISNKNAMIYLGQIEHRTIELLHTLQFKKEKRRQLDGGIRPTAAATKDKTTKASSLRATLNITPPSWEDMESESEEESELRPLTQMELRHRITKDLERRAHTLIQTDQAQSNSDTTRSRDGRKKKKAKR